MLFLFKTHSTVICNKEKERSSSVLFLVICIVYHVIVHSVLTISIVARVTESTESTSVYILSSLHNNNDNNKITRSERVLYVLELSHSQVDRQVKLVTGQTIQRVKCVLETWKLCH